MSDIANQATACSLSEHDKPRFDIHSFDLNTCSRVEINFPVNEFQNNQAGLSHRMETWPADLQRRINAMVDDWSKKNNTRVIRLVSTAIHKGVAVLILHHTGP